MRIVRFLIGLSVLALPVAASAQLVTSSGATAAKQDTGNGYLSTLAGKDFATAAKQDTGNASLASIKTNTDSLDIALSALRDALRGAGSKTLTDVVTALGSLTVAISGSVAVTGPLTDTQLRAVAVPVSGTFWQATQPVSGTVTANAGSGTLAVSGPLTDTQLRAAAVPVDGSGVTQPISGSVTANLGTLNGAATSAKQDTGNTSLASLDTKAPALGQALAAASVPVILPAATITTLTPPAAITGFATSAKQDTLQTAVDAILVDVDKIPAAPATAGNQTTANSSLSSIDGKITAVNTGAVVVSSSALPSLAATSTKQSDGTQKSQVVDGSGNVIGATSNALDINIKSGNPTTIAVTQGTATSLKAQAEAYQGGTAVSSSNPLQVSLANTGSNATAVKVDGSAVTQPVSGTFYQATQPASIADGSDVTLGAKADAKSTATDGTAITIMSVLKEISAMEQAPATRAVTNAGTFATQSAITAASGSIGAGAIASGAMASGAVASGAIASGAVASGAYAAGSIVDGAMVTLGLKTDAASTATDTTSTSVVSVLKEISAKAQAPASTPITSANLDVALSTLATAARQDTGNTSLGTIKTNSDPLVTAGAGGYVRQDSTATIAKESGGNLATIATNTNGVATASNQTTGNTSLATLAGAVTTDGGSVSASGVQIMGMNLTTGQAQPVAVTRNGALVIQNGTPVLPLPPCNPVRRTFCAPRTF